jgi:hypothetical protein
MGRVNKFTDGVFVDIVGNEKEKPSYDRFLDLQSSLVNTKKDLKSYLSRYKKKITENHPLFEELALVETIIMQMRSRDNLKTSDIKMNIVREYIYARIPFHRNDKEGKDIRVIIGLTEIHGTDPHNLSGNNLLLDVAKEKLTLAMENHIQENINKLKSLSK